MQPKARQRSLQTLSRVPLLPNIGSQRGESVRMLQRIEAIEVREIAERDGKTVYVMDIYICEATVRMPVIQQPLMTNQVTNRKPDLRISRRYSEFIKLNKEIYNHAFGGHYWQRCLFCEHVIQSTASGPSLTAKVVSNRETKLKHLTAFMQMLLRLALPTGVPSNWYQPCQGQLQIPSIVYKFIQPSQEDNQE